MKSSSNKAPENKSAAIANQAAKQPASDALKAEDLRPETVAQRELQQIANSSAQVNQLRSYQAMANDHRLKTAQKKDGSTMQLKSNANAPIQRFKTDEAIDSFLEELTDRPTSTPEKELFKKAHGMGVGSTKEITDAQKDYQALLNDVVGGAKIMDTHRSVGYEYEFATYKILDQSIEVDSHNDLGHSKTLGPLFATPFKLETDAQNELEIVTPPFLIADVDNAVNNNAATTLYEAYKSAAKNLREDNLGKKIPEIDMLSPGFGNAWKFNKNAGNMAVNEDREKHTDSDDQVYSQMNISLTAKETAGFMDKQSLSSIKDQEAEVNEGSEIFSKAYFRILNLLEDAIKVAMDDNIEHFLNKIDPTDQFSEQEENEALEAFEEKAETLNILISRSLSNVLAIPGIIYNQKYRDKELLNSLHSSVKETFGVWVKDTIQSVVAGFVANDGGTKYLMALALKSSKGGIIKVIFEELLTDLNGAFPQVELEDPFGEEADLLAIETEKLNRELPDVVTNEANASLEKILQILEDKGPADFDYKSKFLEESFEGEHAGLGVRKETFIKIKSGDKRNLHLAEIRGDDTVKDFLK